MTISYGITVCTEHEELKKLLSFLTLVKRDEDEIVVLVDSGKVTQEVKDVLNSYEKFIQVCFEEFNGDFGDWKNKLAKHCTGSYIFQIDADELPSEHLVKNLPDILEANPGCDLYWVPRINMVDGIEESDVKRWRWNQGQDGRINWPDYQGRIYRKEGTQWVGKVHEQISGHKTYGILPTEDRYALSHFKTIDKQRKQNQYYATIK